LVSRSPDPQPSGKALPAAEKIRQVIDSPKMEPALIANQGSANKVRAAKSIGSPTGTPPLKRPAASDERAESEWTQGNPAAAK
jgi:hypothetical protein